MKDTKVANLEKKKNKKVAYIFLFLSLWQKILGCCFRRKKNYERFGGEAERGKMIIMMNCSCIKVYWQRGKQDYFEDTVSISPPKISRTSVFSVLFLLSKNVQIIISLTKGRGHDEYILSLYGDSVYRLSLLLFCHSEKDLWLCS